MSHVHSPDNRPDPTPLVLERSKDDTDLGWGEAAGQDERRADHEQWLLEQRPPHWD